MAKKKIDHVFVELFSGSTLLLFMTEYIIYFRIMYFTVCGIPVREKILGARGTKTRILKRNSLFDLSVLL